MEFPGFSFFSLLLELGSGSGRGREENKEFPSHFIVMFAMQ